MQIDTQAEEGEVDSISGKGPLAIDDLNQLVYNGIEDTGTRLEILTRHNSEQYMVSMPLHL